MGEISGCVHGIVVRQFGELETNQMSKPHGYLVFSVCAPFATMRFVSEMSFTLFGNIFIFLIKVLKRDLLNLLVVVFSIILIKHIIITVIINIFATKLKTVSCISDKTFNTRPDIEENKLDYY